MRLSNSYFNRFIYNVLSSASIAFIGMAQAVDIRGSKEVSPHLKNIHDEIRTLVKPLYEDRRMDFDRQYEYISYEMNPIQEESQAILSKIQFDRTTHLTLFYFQT